MLVYQRVVLDIFTLYVLYGTMKSIWDKYDLWNQYEYHSYGYISLLHIIYIFHKHPHDISKSPCVSQEICIFNCHLLSGSWFQPLWKILVHGKILPCIMEIKNVPNHQPAHSFNPILFGFPCSPHPLATSVSYVVAWPRPSPIFWPHIWRSWGIQWDKPWEQLKIS